MKILGVGILLCSVMKMSEGHDSHEGQSGQNSPGMMTGMSGQQREFQPPPPSISGCDRAKFQDARLCCKIPQIFSNTSMEACANLAPQFFPMLNQTSNMQNKRVKGQAKRNRKGMRGPADKITEDGSLDVDVLKSMFNSKTNSAWQGVLSQAVTDCQALQASSNMTFPDLPQFKLSTMMMLKCIRQNLFMNCPTDSISTTDSTCPTKLAALSECNPFAWVPRMPMMGPMGGGRNGEMEEGSRPSRNGRIRNRMGS